MIYRICTIADIHFGALDPERLYNELQLVNESIKTAYDCGYKTDLVVLAGDYWDSKQSLNNKVSYYGIKWMKELVDLAEECDFIIRVILGTKSHDHDQLDVFDSFNPEVFKIFRKNTYEETLPGLHALYCPDENIPTDKYIETYIDNLTREDGYQIGFFHGNFDLIMMGLPSQETEVQSSNNVVFEYKLFDKIISGPMLAGHWHTHMVHKKLTYVGSFSRFGFGEEEDKGFISTVIDTENPIAFANNFVINLKAQAYKSFIIDTAIFKDIDDYAKIFNSVEKMLLENPDIKIRIRIDAKDDTPQTKKYIDNVRNQFVNNRNVKVVVRNRYAEEKKKEKENEKKEELVTYDFIEDKNMSAAVKLQKFILSKYGISVPIDFIQKYTNVYLK